LLIVRNTHVTGTPSFFSFQHSNPDTVSVGMSNRSVRS
jgi:hypothetical protein